MILALLALAGALSAGEPSRPPEALVVSHRGDTTFAVVPEGVAARIPLPRWFVSFHRPPAGLRAAWNRVEVAASRPGRRELALRAVAGFRKHLVRIDVVPRRPLPLRLHPLGAKPVVWRDSALFAEVGAELGRLFEGTGIVPTLERGNPVALPPSPSFWDPDGDGHLDLVRNEGERGTPELDSLDDWIAGRKLSFPDLLLLQTPVRVGWSLAAPLRRGDSLLELAGRATLPWRDSRGAPVRYVVRSKTGANPDTFVVDGYEGDTMRVRTTARGGRWSRDHDPLAELVWRPDHDIPGFGITSSRRPDAAPLLVLPDADALEDPHRAARVIAREIGHRAGLDDVDAAQNPMSAILRLDIRKPTWLPDQVLRLQESLKSYP